MLNFEVYNEKDSYLSIHKDSQITENENFKIILEET